MRLLALCCFVGFLLVAVVAVDGFCWLISGPRCKVSIRTAAITNDTAGIRHATFTVVNTGHSKAYVFDSYAFEIRSGKWRSDLIPRRSALAAGTNMVGHLPGGGRILLPGQSCDLSIPLPFDDWEWRATMTTPHLQLNLRLRSMTGSPKLGYIPPIGRTTLLCRADITLETVPNPAASLDGGRPVLFAFLARCPAASEPQRSAAV